MREVFGDTGVCILHNYVMICICSLDDCDEFDEESVIKLLFD